ncbi:Bug family tripartite tricarboxylate transporter substrate binding protein [Falsiroseomonas stagni]|uniref:Tripartite-type tricarboxylate transporter, receptor component TctC n=1 Tax=Falsiroseomonas stagni DSM 19981 TaxID=1123062 RepID=A0A1I4EJ49_9PROT|nr:tripartite tricarboxylate transporter substrate binding protein [Falsiroseomonas stagni]SFL05289.1 Tripartite-type tricarboxylate transporter, receptor component TctC [Falsiroseomonas stagni DSM 19981]
MIRLNRRAILGGAATLVAAPLAQPALAQPGLPDRPIRIIVPYNAGGITDVISRGVAVGLQATLGQPVVVENRPGANGTVGTLAAARSTPDGTTITMGITDTFAINRSTFPNLPYSDETDFAPISMVTRVPFALMIGAHRREITDYASFVREARREAGRLSHASWGVGSSSHLAFEFVARAQGFEKLHVPFAAQAPGMQAVAAGQVDSMMLPVGGAESLARDNRARIIALAHPNRIDLTPGVPTLGELGVPLSTGLWLALYAPARTPPAIIARLNEALRTGMRHETTQAVFRQQAGVAEPSTPEELATFVRAERAQWAQLVREKNIRVEA